MSNGKPTFELIGGNEEAEAILSGMIDCGYEPMVGDRLRIEHPMAVYYFAVSHRLVTNSGGYSVVYVCHIIE